eukprot:575517-Pleurochrysis_carterae.AAC.1
MRAAPGAERQSAHTRAARACTVCSRMQHAARAVAIGGKACEHARRVRTQGAQANADAACACTEGEGESAAGAL